MSQKQRPFIGVVVQISDGFDFDVPKQDKLKNRIRAYLKSGGFRSHSVSIQVVKDSLREEAKAFCYVTGRISYHTARATAKRITEDTVRALNFVPIACTIRFGTETIATFRKKTNNFKKRL